MCTYVWVHLAVHVSVESRSQQIVFFRSPRDPPASAPGCRQVLLCRAFQEHAEDANLGSHACASGTLPAELLPGPGSLLPSVISQSLSIFKLGLKVSVSIDLNGAGGMKRILGEEQVRRDCKAA